MDPLRFEVLELRMERWTARVEGVGFSRCEVKEMNKEEMTLDYWFFVYSVLRARGNQANPA
jgi:hypothetical protein